MTSKDSNTSGIVRATVNDGRSIRVYFVDDLIPANYNELFSNYGTVALDKINSPYLVVSCRNKQLARQCEQYALKLDNWDTGEVINWAQNVESLYLECIHLAGKYQTRPIRAQMAIRSAILSSGVLEGQGVRVSRVDWHGVAQSFIASL